MGPAVGRTRIRALPAAPPPHLAGRRVGAPAPKLGHGSWSTGAGSLELDAQHVGALNGRVALAGQGGAMRIAPVGRERVFGAEPRDRDFAGPIVPDDVGGVDGLAVMVGQQREDLVFVLA